MATPSGPPLLGCPSQAWIPFQLDRTAMADAYAPSHEEQPRRKTAKRKLSVSKTASTGAKRQRKAQDGAYVVRVQEYDESIQEAAKKYERPGPKLKVKVRPTNCFVPLFSPFIELILLIR